MTKLLDLAQLREVLKYDATTGVFTWLISPSSKVLAGDVAGCASATAYRRIRLYGVQYSAHRLAWFYTHGVWPTFCVDHIDGDKSNDRLVNLREASAAENAQNRRQAHGKNKSTGVLGVVARTLKSGLVVFVAHITVNRAQKHLGVFAAPDLAHAAYIAAKRELHPFGTI